MWRNTSWGFPICVYEYEWNLCEKVYEQFFITSPNFLKHNAMSFQEALIFVIPIQSTSHFQKFSEIYFFLFIVIINTFSMLSLLFKDMWRSKLRMHVLLLLLFICFMYAQDSDKCKGSWTELLSPSKPVFCTKFSEGEDW